MDELVITPETTKEGSGESSLVLFLGLYLLVLAFFILLVSISTIEKVRSVAVMDSLSSSFASILPPTMDPTRFSALEGDALGGPPFQERVASLFATALQVAKVEIVQPGRLMRVTVPTVALFFPDDTRVRPESHPLLDRIVASVSGRPPGTRYDMEFVMGSRYAVGRSLPVAQTLEMARAGAFAREMATRGVPPDSIAIGLVSGNPEEVVIWFYVRSEEETRLQLLDREAKPTPTDPAPAPASPAPEPAREGAL